MKAIEAYDLEQLGELMNICQGLLNASAGVDCWEVEELIQIAREHGALGAKLTGGGGADRSSPCVRERRGSRRAGDATTPGYQAMEVQIG